jgi:EAL domain-containing protein (putative c-di-GMP-specific phosphodiesterase class I)
MSSTAPHEDVDPFSFATNERDRSTIAMVRDALDAGRVGLAFQPVVATADGSVAFHEGLIRLQDETGRTIPAGRFMDLIEVQELGRLIDVAALRIGLATLAGHPDLRLAINMSARSIGYPRWMQTLKRGLARDGTAAERLILEITETSAMQVPELVKTFMTDLQGRGITFALDDFGAGQTSFRHLRELLFDIVKIDGTFVRGCDRDADNQCILAALAEIGRQFDMFTVAESVETRAEAAYLATIGIDCLQGYHYGAPEIRPAWFRPAGRKAPGRVSAA